MENIIHTLPLSEVSKEPFKTREFMDFLENGQVIFLPNLPFQAHELHEKERFGASILDGKHKNVSFNIQTKEIGGCHTKEDDLRLMMERYAHFAKELILSLCPNWENHLEWGRTSYRPSEIKGRASSKRKDDTKLHVDSFAATPVHGKRILRVFSNINPEGKPRVWELGEPFPEVLKKFSSRLPQYRPAIAKLLRLLKITKTERSAYDHYQLHLHNAMKEDENYQQNVSKIRFDFPSGSTWIVFTDQVSHAALGGQYLMEQTFYLPVTAQQNPDISPLECWKKEKCLVIRNHSAGWLDDR